MNIYIVSYSILIYQYTVYIVCTKMAIHGDWDIAGQNKITGIAKLKQWNPNYTLLSLVSLYMSSYEVVHVQGIC